MRRHFWQFLVTDTGEPIENATISVFQAGSTTPVTVYLDEIGVTRTGSAPQVTTSRKGYFEFWIADATEPYGYSLSTKFKISWSAPGISEGYIDYIDIFAASFEEVVLGDYGTTKNKTVSNAMATGWENHISLSIDTYAVHGILGIDEGDYSNSALNKLLSNRTAYYWETHRTTLYSGGVWFSSNIPVGDLSAPPLENPHGIDFVDVTDTNADTNKLVSNLMGKNWTLAYDSLYGVTPLFSKLDGSYDYTAPVGYDNLVTFASLGNNDFITKSQFANHSHRQTIAIGDWSLVSGLYEYVLVLPVGKTMSSGPIITCWASNLVIHPLNIEYLSSTSIKLTMDTNISVLVHMCWSPS